jgi:hypothetical protein
MNNHRLEINDLIDSAVNNAVARRNEALVSVSDEEAKNVSGGIALTSIALTKRFWWYISYHKRCETHQTHLVRNKHSNC